MLRALTIVSLIAAIGCSSANNESPSTQPAPEAGPAPYTPKDNREFFEASAVPICERVYSCCMTAEDRMGVLFLFGLEGDAPADAAACATALKSKLGDFSQIVESSISGKRLKFVPEEASACYAQYVSEQNKCEGLFGDEGVPRFLDCPKAYQPLVAIGGSCNMATECIDSVCRPTNAERTAATCQAKGKEGDFCLGLDTCEEGLSCAQPIVEDACVETKSSVCRKLGVKGTRCCSTDDCQSGLDCYAEGDGKPMCNTMLPTTPVPPTCTGK